MLLPYSFAILKRTASACRYYIHKNNVRLSSSATKSIHDVNTKVTKDVILFKYENPKYFMYMNIFAVVQYMFWTYLGVFALKNLRDAPVDPSSVDEETPWFRKINLGENKYKNTLGAVALLVGK